MAGSLGYGCCGGTDWASTLSPKARHNLGQLLYGDDSEYQARRAIACERADKLAEEEAHRIAERSRTLEGKVIAIVDQLAISKTVYKVTLTDPDNYFKGSLYEPSRRYGFKPLWGDNKDGINWAIWLELVKPDVSASGDITILVQTVLNGDHSTFEKGSLVCAHNHNQLACEYFWKTKFVVQESFNSEVY